MRSALARVPARRHGVERLHAAARAGVERSPGTTSRSSARSRIPSATTSAARGRAARRRRPAARVRARPLRGLRGASSCRTARATSSTRWVEANAAALRELAARRPRLREPRAAAAERSARRRARGMRSRRTAPSSSTRCAARPELEAWGREALAGADGAFVGSAHIREVLEEVVRPRRAACTRYRRGSTSTSGVPRPRAEALAALLDRGAARSAESRQRERAAPGRGERRAARGVPRGRASRRSSTSGS